MNKIFIKLSSNLRVIISLSALLILLLLYSALRDRAKLININELNNLANSKQIESVLIDDDYFYFITKKDREYKIIKGAVNKSFIYKHYKVEKRYDRRVIYYSFLILSLFAILFAFLYLNFRKKETLQPEEYQKTKEEEIVKEDIIAITSDITFDDVAGIKDAKDELEEIIDFLKNPQKYRALNLKLPKGVLLVGSPGVGKTYIAKAVAGEAEVPFYYQSGASFVQIYVGMGALRVKELFNKAKQNAPSIIFIDEIDSVGKKRGEFRNDEREATLNELLTQMDGFEDSSGVIIIGATNNISSMDDALLRSGRFDRRVYISLPDMSERIEVLTHYLADKSNSVDIEALARITVGFSNASLSTLINEAGLYAIRDGREIIEDEDLEAVREKVINGKRKILSLTYEERELQALYQSAKAIVATWYDVEFDKIGIVTTKLLSQDIEIISKNQILDRAKIYLAGNIAVEKIYKDKFTNAKDDIKIAKSLIEDVVDKYSMVDEFYPNDAEKDKIYQELIVEITTLIDKLDIPLDRIKLYLLQYENITQEKIKEIMREIF
ncbi:Cell division protein FtsH [hydrothermal vent metagenome]|uniref:Cell division protein FtsH n=1 Tax=hydrothermal vent metagenome TaxID=652676 RepID=A0A1W1EI51_9ZZZZ